MHGVPWLRSLQNSEWPVHSTALNRSIRVAGKNSRPFLLSRLSSRGDLGILSYVLSLPFGSGAYTAWCSNQTASGLEQVSMTTQARLLAIAGAILAGRAGGRRSPAASRMGGCFSTVSPAVVKMSFKMSAPRLPLPGTSLLRLSTLAWEQCYSRSSPKGCCSCTSICVLLKEDFRLSDPESAALDGRICQQVH